MKQNKGQNTGQGPGWHPDFRIAAALPDNKVVRTDFIINGIALAILAIVVWAFYSRESQLQEATAEVARWTADIDANKAKFNEALGLQREFSEAEKRLAEVSAFAKSPIEISELINRLGNSLPKLVAIDVVERREDVFVIRGTIVGASERATGIANSYLDALNADAYFAQRFEGIRLNNINREARANRLFFEIGMKLKKAD
ncbi:MAG TPA: hypothetical protein VIK52_10260 [Opitutaceae bacterium]